MDLSIHFYLPQRRKDRQKNQISPEKLCVPLRFAVNNKEFPDDNAQEAVGETNCINRERCASLHASPGFPLSSD